MCWSVQKPELRYVPIRLDMNRKNPKKNVISHNVPRGVFIGDYRKEAVIATIAGAIFGFVLVGPMTALTAAGAAAGLHRTLWNNEKIAHQTKVNERVADNSDQVTESEIKTHQIIQDDSRKQTESTQQKNKVVTVAAVAASAAVVIPNIKRAIQG